MDTATPYISVRLNPWFLAALAAAWVLVAVLVRLRGRAQVGERVVVYLRANPAKKKRGERVLAIVEEIDGGSARIRYPAGERSVTYIVVVPLAACRRAWPWEAP